MRSRFDNQLSLLNTELIEMGSLCETAIADAVKALVQGDLELARKTIDADKRVDQKERDIEALCLKLLLQQQPVARDLRLISAALKMITDMERIGDQAADISEIVLVTDLSIPHDFEHIKDMADATIKMVTESIDAFVERDLVLAKEVIDYDDVVDNLFDEIKLAVIDAIAATRTQNQEAEDKEKLATGAIDILMIAKYFERIGDHATNIAEWVEFSITGTHDSLTNS
ncbi:phosphate signaling complex protein PhoU [Clostridium aminobutyricum]|uniref:Phosphate-specific transport system accessory protein PhoU n=1 Tax=Clostridium aminobutyricum TaxID=33953 RepID=A0A939D8L9_CLOAM|nr:phosphate signaling complex protein PhoU [Clostridium aminobutyricum]MBN7773130.1 phosphate signaling complex protein PhoU [Clostridium aminobutyricum]